jgi:hypothetical protein
MLPDEDLLPDDVGVPAVLSQFAQHVEVHPALHQAKQSGPRGRAATAVVRDPEPLDLMLYNRTADPFSAHVAVWMAPGEILHLCHEIGVPVIWPPAMFAARPRYATLIGLKRVTARPPYPAAGFWSC